MTEKEMILLELIRNHTDPEKALEVAVAVIVTFLKREETVDDFVDGLQ